MPPRARRIEARRKAFIRQWQLKHRAVADSLEEAGDRLFTFARLPPSQWRSACTTNAIERLHEEFKRSPQSPLTSPPETIPSCHVEFQPHHGRHRAVSATRLFDLQ